MTSHFSQPSCLASFVLLLAGGALAARASAQCSTQWLPGQGVPGTDGPVLATTVWDPDGLGPQQPVVVVGGAFSVAGTAVASIATHDPVSGVWSALGTRFNSQVLALTTLPNGDLVAGGNFTNAGGGGADWIARWNGTSWSPLGTGMNGVVRALLVLPNGDLVAGFGYGAATVARWNGTSWSPLGTWLNGWVLALTALPNGDIVAGGQFTSTVGLSVNRVARWDGTSWSALGSGMNGNVLALTTLPNGDLVAGGEFTTAGGVSANYLARWDGTSWSALGSGMYGSVWAMMTLPNGDLVTAGSSIARWNGATWSVLGPAMSGPSWTAALSMLPNGDIVAGGYFTMAGGVNAYRVARWDGATWSALRSGMSGPYYTTWVNAVTTMPNGDIVAGGQFTTAGGVSANNVARWDGTNWSALGTGMNSASYVHALKALPSGDLVAGGDFSTAGSVSVNRIARWNGMNWSALGAGMNGPVYALTMLPNGDLVAGGAFTTAGSVSANNTARWSGTNWSALGQGMNGPVYALMTLPNGDIVAGGSFTMAGGVSANFIARWSGTSWSALGAGTNSSVRALTTLANGDIAAGGSFTMAGGVSAYHTARWNGATWSALGSWLSGPSFSTRVNALTSLPNGDLVAGGVFFTAGGVGVNNIARWNGTSWSALGSGMSSSLEQHETGVFALTMLPNGDLVAGGDFTIVNDAVSAYIARLTTTCPATTASYGSGCSGSVGSHVLAAASLPWTGSTFRSVATGMPSNALAIGVRGLSTTSILLSSLLPQGVAGCTLRVNPDVLDLYVPTTGSVQTQFAIPNTVVLAGQIFHQQIVPVELDSLGNIIALTSTNRLTVTIGTF